MTTRAPLHVPADLDATLHAAICDLRTTTRLTDGTRSERVAHWAEQIKAAAVKTLGNSSMPRGLFESLVIDASARLNERVLVAEFERVAS